MTYGVILTTAVFFLSFSSLLFFFFLDTMLNYGRCCFLPTSHPDVYRKKIKALVKAKRDDGEECLTDDELEAAGFLAQ